MIVQLKPFVHLLWPFSSSSFHSPFLRSYYTVLGNSENLMTERRQRA